MGRKQLLLFAALFSLSASAQLPTLDVTVADNGRGQLEARFRSDGYFDGMFAATVFTIRWRTDAGYAFSEAQPIMPWLAHMYISVNDDIQAADGYTYRVHAGFGNNSLASANHHFEPGKEYVVFVMDVLVPGTEFELIQNDWTTANNGPYFISLNGVERTGEFFESPKPMIDIKSIPSGGNSINVALNPQDNFFGWISDVDFTLRWPSNSTTIPGIPTQPDSVLSYLPVSRIGSEITSGGYTYQRFHGEGTQSIARAGYALRNGVDQPIINIPISGQLAGVEVVNDAWTAANEGNYAILLNGEEQTGTIIDLSTAVSEVEQLGFSVQVVDNDGQLTVHVTTDRQGPMTCKLLNSRGQILWSTKTRVPLGQTKHPISMATLPPGMYLLNTELNGRTVTTKVVR